MMDFCSEAKREERRTARQQRKDLVYEGRKGKRAADSQLSPKITMMRLITWRN